MVCPVASKGVMGYGTCRSPIRPTPAGRLSMQQKKPYVKPTLTQEASLTDGTLVIAASGGPAL